jgi:hypothetical protein
LLLLFVVRVVAFIIETHNDRGGSDETIIIKKNKEKK